MPRHPRRVILLLLPLLIAACRDSKVDAYQVPKEKDAALVATTKPAFLEFLKSVKAAAPAAP